MSLYCSCITLRLETRFVSPSTGMKPVVKKCNNIIMFNNIILPELFIDGTIPVTDDNAFHYVEFQISLL